MVEIRWFTDLPYEVKEYYSKVEDLLRCFAEQKDETDFLSILGGYVYIIEREEEISEIPALSIKPDFVECDLLKEDCILDIAEKLENFFLICLITNNAGGNTYLIPASMTNKYLSRLVERVKESY